MRSPLAHLGIARARTSDESGRLCPSRLVLRFLWTISSIDPDLGANCARTPRSCALSCTAVGSQYCECLSIRTPSSLTVISLKPQVSTQRLLSCSCRQIEANIYFASFTQVPSENIRVCLFRLKDFQLFMERIL